MDVSKQDFDIDIMPSPRLMDGSNFCHSMRLFCQRPVVAAKAADAAEITREQVAAAMRILGMQGSRPGATAEAMDASRVRRQGGRLVIRRFHA